MAGNAEDLTVNYEEAGQQLVQEVDKRILTKGAWTTILFKYQDWDNKKQEFGQFKFTIRRYQKREGEYRQKSKFNISSVEQANKIIAALQEWIAEDEKVSDDKDSSASND